MNFPPTPEQQAFLDTAVSGAPIIVGQAGAGTGKTATISLLADAWADYGVGGIYITLNKNVAQEVGRKFHRGNVAAMTIHSLAYRVASRTPHIAPLMQRLNDDNKLPRWKAAKHLRWTKGMRYVSFKSKHARDAGLGPAEETELSPAQIMSKAHDAVAKWCSSADESISAKHVTRPRNMPQRVFKEVYAPLVAEAATRLWTTDLTSPEGRCTFTHDHYLKLVSLDRPNLVRDHGDLLSLSHGSLLFLDEAQDARPSIIELVRAQVGYMRIVVVGDSAQAIYRFTGAVDALPMFSSMDNSVTLPLTKSWRFGEGSASYANQVLEALDTPIRVRGNEAIETRVEKYIVEDGPEVTPPVTDAVLVRTNAELVTETIRESSRGRKVCAMADIRGVVSVMEDIQRISNGKTAKHPDLKELGTMQELEAFVDPDKGYAGDLGPTIRLGLDLGPDEVIRVLESCVPAEAADVTVSTMHKSKGREWDSVRLAGDPMSIVPMAPFEEDERTGTPVLSGTAKDSLMLYYVAVTRGRREVFIPDMVYGAMEDCLDDIKKVRAGGLLV